MSANETDIWYIPTGLLAASAACPRYRPNYRDADLLIEGISFTPHIAVTANDTNYRTLSATVAGENLFTPVPTTVAGGSLVAGTQVDFTLLTTPAAISARRLAAGTGELLVNAAVTASGVALDGEWIVKLRRVRAQS